MKTRTRKVDVTYGPIESEFIRLRDSEVYASLRTAFSHKYKELNHVDWLITKIDYGVSHTQTCGFLIIKAIFTEAIVYPTPTQQGD
jgi:hypothetical protein